MKILRNSRSRGYDAVGQGIAVQKRFDWSYSDLLPIKKVSNALAGSLLSLFLLMFPVKVALGVVEYVVLIPGLDFEKFCTCGGDKRSDACVLRTPKPSCPDSFSNPMWNWYSHVSEYLNEKNKFAKIKMFEWSRDPVSHGEGGTNLKDKFERWFYSDVCPERDCIVSLIGHSWGSVILTDFLASVPDDAQFKIRAVITYGSPAAAAQVDDEVNHFLYVAQKRFESHKVDDNSEWLNLVNQDDPAAWNYPLWKFSSNSYSTLKNLEPPDEDVVLPSDREVNSSELITSGKKLFKDRWGDSELFPLSNSEMAPKYAGQALTKVINRRHHLVAAAWDPTGQYNHDFSRHWTSAYNPKWFSYWLVGKIPVCNFFDRPKSLDQITSDALDHLCSESIITGFKKEGRFWPEEFDIDYLVKLEEPITRGELAKIVSIPVERRTGNSIPPESECGAAPFKDVTRNEWYCTYIRYLKDWGYIHGYGQPGAGACPPEGGNQYFCPNEHINYAATVKLILTAIWELDANDLSDVDLGQPWFHNYMECATEKGLFSHMAGEVDGEKIITRGEAIVLVSKAIHSAQNISSCY